MLQSTTDKFTQEGETRFRRLLVCVSSVSLEAEVGDRGAFLPSATASIDRGPCLHVRLFGIITDLRCRT